MKVKLLIGIVIPLILIIGLVIVNTAGIGFSIQQEAVKEIAWNVLIQNQSPQNPLPIQTITLQNDFFIPKRYTLPFVIACLKDIHGEKAPIDIEVKYSQMPYASDGSTPLLDEIFFDMSFISKQSIEVPAYGKKQVKLYLTPKYVYADEDINRYKGYEALIVIDYPEKKGSYYYSSYCATLNEQDRKVMMSLNIQE